jgi:hypothetical protein
MDDAEKISAQYRALELDGAMRKQIACARNFSHHLVDWIFATFVQPAFTNAFDAVCELRARSCL